MSDSRTQPYDHAANNMMMYFAELCRMFSGKENLRARVMASSVIPTMLELVADTFALCCIRDGWFDHPYFTRVVEWYSMPENRNQPVELRISNAMNFLGKPDRKRHCTVDIQFNTFMLRYTSLNSPGTFEVLDGNPSLTHTPE